MKVVINSSPLIFLAKLGLLGILDELFDEVYITDAVYHETIVEGAGHEEALDIKNAGSLKRVSVANHRIVKFLLEMIDHGEAETIIATLENGFDLVILDDKDARKVARSFGLNVTGTLGILLLAKERGLISEIKAYVKELRKHGFRISEEVVRKILESGGELKS